MDSDEEEVDDATGLERAYASGSKIYRNRDTLYIAGTASIGDVMQWPDIPLHRAPQTTRYRTANDYLSSESGRGVKRLVGHSLGGSVSLELSKNHPGNYVWSSSVRHHPTKPLSQTGQGRMQVRPSSITGFRG